VGTAGEMGLAPGRRERGRQIPALPRLPYFPEQAVELLANFDRVVLAGARDPVAFFGYAGVPSQIVPEEKLLPLAGVGDDIQGALEGLADALLAPPLDFTAPALPDPSPSGPLDPNSLGALLARWLPENAIVVDEAATSGLPFSIHSAGAAPHTLLSLTGGAIGQGLPCATGAALACPDRKVVAFQADGSGQYTLQSLWTQKREELDVLTLICANRSYRILQVELARAGIAEPGPKARALTNLSEPTIDWVSLATGYGVPAERVETTDQLAAALERRNSETGPRLVEMVL
jgi:acetolactate synthase-1/2/3 large subunit